MCQRTASILWLILCLLVGAGVARSQPIGGPDGGTGSIDGLVTDQQGAVVAAAYVTARNIKTAQTFTARSGVDGAFAIQGLEFGDYEVQVSAPGFANYLMRISLTPESAAAPHSAQLQATMGTAQINVVMHPGGETVLVCIVCGYTYFTLPFRSIPLLDRDPQKLIQLQAGVTQHARAFSINGARTSAKISTLDGFDDRSSRNGDLVAGVSLDSVTEVNSDYYAGTSVESNYGPNRTPEIAATTNSGSNQVHADAFWYGTRTGLDANGFFTNRGGLASDSTLYDQAGVAVGGPFVLPGVFNLRDHAFFFGSFERTRDDRGAGRQVLAPLPEFIARTSGIQGPLFRSLVSRGAIPVPAGAPIRLANAGIDGSADIGDFVVPAALARRHNLAFGRIDVVVGTNIQMNARYAVDQSRLTDDFSGDTFSPASPLRTSAGASLLGLGSTQIISPVTVNEARLGYRSWRASTSGAESDLVSVVAINSPLQVGASEIPATERGRALFLADSISHVAGPHSLKFGGQIVKRNEVYISGRQNKGVVYYSDLLALITHGARSSGDPARSIVQVQMALPETQHYGPTDFYGFASDTWRPGPGSVVNLGLGYNFYSGAVYDGAPSANRNFAPSLSFARALMGSEAVILRGGASVVYGAPVVLPYADIVATPLYPLTTAFSRLQGLVGLPLPARSTASSEAQSIERVFSRKMRPAYTESAFFAMQHSHGRLFVLDIAYHLALARHLTTFSRVGSRPIDIAGAADANLPAGGDFLVSSDGNSSYHSLEVRVTSRERRGLVFEAHYTLSKSIDSVSTDGPAVFGSLAPGPVYGENSAANRALSDFDRRHRAVGLFLWRPREIKAHPALRPLLNGWEASGLITIQSGPHVTLYSGGDFFSGLGDFNRDGILNDRVAFLGRGPLASALVGSSSPADSYVASSLFGAPSPAHAPLGRNVLPAPGYASIDLSVQKNVRIRESRLELRIEAFNLANRVNFAPPVTDLVSGDFGRSRASGNARIIRLAVRYRF